MSHKCFYSVAIIETLTSVMWLAIIIGNFLPLLSKIHCLVVIIFRSDGSVRVNSEGVKELSRKSSFMESADSGLDFKLDNANTSEV